MPIEIIELSRGVGTTIIGMGVVNEKELVRMIINHLNQDREKLRRHLFSLIDLTEVTDLRISAQAVQEIADYCVSAAMANGEAVVAIVANQDFIYGYARMWEILSYQTSWDIMVFRKTQNAKDWIKKSVKDRYGIDVLRSAGK